MSGRITLQDDVVATLADDHAVADDHRAVGLITLLDGLIPKGARLREEPSLGLVGGLDDWR